MKNLFSSIRIHTAVLQTDHTIRYQPHKLQLMQRHQNRHMLLLRQQAKEIQEFQLISDIKERCRLIEDQNTWLLADRFGQKDPLPLTRCR